LGLVFPLSLLQVVHFFSIFHLPVWRALALSWALPTSRCTFRDEPAAFPSSSSFSS